MLHKKFITLYSITLLFIISSLVYAKVETYTDNPEAKKNEEQENTQADNKVIRKIIVEGNTLIPTPALIVKVPYREGEKFDPSLTGQLIRNLYGLNYFDSIEVKGKDISLTEMDLYIIVKEKKKLENIIYQGIRGLKQEEIEKKLKLSEIPAINQEELELCAEKIKKFYGEKDYHSVNIVPELRSTPSGNAEAIFNIKEGNKAVVKRVIFQGNKSFSSKKLKEMIFTREDWLLGFMDKAGTYQPDAIEYDKHTIENFYQSNGFLTARVTNAVTDIDAETQWITVTFNIEEGELFTIKSVSAPGNHLLTEEQLVNAIPIKPGQLYSKEAIRQTMDLLRLTWGQYGYIYADIEPSIQPDLEKRTVEITFYSDLGNKVFLNRINIIGNNKQRDYVIRRYIILNEGELLTTQQMEFSKKRIESLGFFEPQGGVEWKINKVSEGLVDLDLVVQEIKTGKLYGQVGYGGADPQSPSNSLRVGAGLTDRSFLGTGIRYNLNLTYSREDRGVLFNIFQPWLFDRPIGAGVDAYHRKALYEDFSNVQEVPVETVTGGSVQFTFAPQSHPDLAMFLIGGIEKISYASTVTATQAGKTPEEIRLFQELLDRRFQAGNLSWINLNMGQDLRNHPIFPSRGYNWNLATKVGLPVKNNFGFFKLDADVSWLTPLIGEYDLIFFLHGHMGYIHPFKDKVVPYRELYHVGGPASVRGFTFGEIGPQLFSDSIGAKKAFWVNAELIFSITKDQSMRGVLFYDGGAGWDTPNANSLVGLPLINNRFNYRHSVGFGIRLTKPTPLRIDWGFKLDRNRKRNERPFEVHFSMAQEF